MRPAARQPDIDAALADFAIDERYAAAMARTAHNIHRLTAAAHRRAAAAQARRQDEANRAQGSPEG